jgi:adenylate cyclase
MRVVLQSPFAGVEPSRRKKHQDPGRSPPELRLVGHDVAINGAVPRLAVIVAADMVDYTRHMADDESGTHARCTTLRRTVIEPGLARHGARVIKHTGDGFIAELASATGAVWFAVTFQHTIRSWNARHAREAPIEFRVGINLGDVIREAHDVFGHSVNIASRLEALARPGGVLVSHAVATSVRDPRLRFEDAGELSLKNVSEPMRGFHVRLAAPRLSRRSRGVVAAGWGEQRDSNP